MSTGGNGTLGNYLNTTTNVGSFDADYTCCWWMQPSSTAPSQGDGFQVVCTFGDSPGAACTEFYLNQAPSFRQPRLIVVADTVIGGGVVSATAMTFFALVHTAGGASTTVYRGAGNTALTTTVIGGATPTVPTQALQLFNEMGVVNEPLNGDLIGFRAWSVALTAAEVQIEYQGGMKPKTQLGALARFHPLLNATDCILDWSGHGFNFTLTGALSTKTTAPPVSWGAPPLL